MKFGFCANMNATQPDGIGRETFKCFAEAGYDYVELPLSQIMSLAEKDFLKLIKETEIFTDGCYACNNFFPPEIKLTGVDVNYSRVEQYAKKAIERAGRLGARIIVLGSAGSKNIPYGYPLKEAEDQLKKNLTLIYPYLKQANIKIALEPLNRIESNMINSVEQAVIVAGAINKPNIGVLCDFYHLCVEKEPIENLKKTGENLIHVHIAALLGRRFPLSRQPEFDQLFKSLYSIGYPGCISVEAYSNDLETEPADSLKLLKRIV